mgnify:CR=1 FL=1
MREGATAQLSFYYLANDSKLVIDESRLEKTKESKRYDDIINDLVFGRHSQKKEDLSFGSFDSVQLLVVRDYWKPMNVIDKENIV